MRSALLVGPEQALMAAVRDVLVREGAVASEDGYVLVETEGVRALLYEYPGDDWQQPPLPGHDVSAYRAIMVESRSPSLVAGLFLRLADALPGPLLLIDAADVVWSAESVVATRLVL